MMNRHLLEHGTLQTPQTEAIPGRPDMAENNAGGFGWTVNDWTLMSRFLILGTEGGTYYVSENKLTKEAAAATMRCIELDGKRAVDLIIDISESGRAAKNDYTLFALAMAAGSRYMSTRSYALTALPRVCRIGTHLFHFLSYVEQFRGWGRLLRIAVAAWYNNMPADKLAYQVMKYRQRDGWSHRDVLRLSHPTPPDEVHNFIYHYITQGRESTSQVSCETEMLLSLKPIAGFELAKDLATVESNTTFHVTAKAIAKVIETYNLPRECVPTEYLTDKAVWKALLHQMPMTAMIRNLGNMGKVGLLNNLDSIAKIVGRLGDADLLKKSRIHPLAVLVALNVYSSGQGYRGSGTWDVVGDITDALDGAFYKSFDNVTPTGKRICIALDVSGSMDWREIHGMPGITPRVGAAAMSMVTYKVEPKVAIMAFSHELVPVNISRCRRLDDVMKHIDDIQWGGTDCALPMLWALERHKQDQDVVFDAFIIYTDSETWYGNIHPKQALDQYRRKVNPNAKLIVVGMIGNEESIADPQDSGMLDVVGFDTTTPNLISNFLSE